MRSFAERSQATPQARRARRATPSRAHTGPSHQSIPLLHLQRTIGNQAIQRLLRDHPHGFDALQRKPTLSSPGDAFEVEADRVADQVMGMREPQLQRACSCGGRCAGCREAAPLDGSLGDRVVSRPSTPGASSGEGVVGRSSSGSMCLQTMRPMPNCAS